MIYGFLLFISNSSTLLRDVWDPSCVSPVHGNYSHVQDSLSVQLGFRQTSPPIASGWLSKQVSPSTHSYPELPPQDWLHWEIFGVGVEVGVLVGLMVGVGEGVLVAVGRGVLVGIGVFVGVAVGVLVGPVVHRTWMGLENWE